MMYKMLIVDDERRVREGLANKIPWQKFHIIPCALADDGESALPILEKTRPDILLTDVRMRRMDGLSLAEQAKKILPDIQIVFLSGYSDSEYLRHALKLQAVDYIYKPVNLQEVEKVFSKLSCALDEKIRLRAVHSQMASILEKGMPVLQERFLNDWFLDRITDEHIFFEKAEQLKIPVQLNQSMIIIVFELDFTQTDENVSRVMLYEKIRQFFPSVLLTETKNNVIALIQENCHDQKKIFPDIQKIISDLTVQDASLHISAWISDILNHPLQVPQTVQTAQKALKERFFSGSNQVFSHETKLQSENSLPFKMPALFEEHLRAGNYSALKQCIQKCLQEIKKRRDIDSFRSLCIHISFEAERILEECGIQKNLALSFCSEVLQINADDVMEERLLALAQNACDFISAMRENRGKSLSSSVYAFIQSHLSEKITIDIIAKNLHYSCAYLSTVFKQETGETIGNAIVKEKMQLAMRLLRETDDMIYQIALKTGYTEQAHFTRLFKKITGLTPNEYRKQALP